jgi:hypothetical protein
MKSLLLVGGLTGWGLGMGISYLQGSAWPACLWHGCVAAYLSALLMRWWGRVWRNSLAQSVRERELAQDAMITTTNTPKASRT